jgi:hypothetical protein
VKTNLCAKHRSDRDKWLDAPPIRHEIVIDARTGPTGNARRLMQQQIALIESFCANQRGCAV